ncbi:uncharacterized protein LOC123532488 [Mercenaria mercenaria]|uniref:uncharacterized protein LOC123532488 n=1 Tax=Mercenaria mercenaria TaxID=6596 RepID=UPI00234E48AF|nr:uncharacterized protein LOC123532488 [Mercenaria mercenaria]
MSSPSKIKSKPYRNWVRGALGLFYLQEGLYPFTDRVVKAEQARIVQNLPPCTNCAIENILPDHASRKDCFQRNKTKCNCRKKKTNKNCATCSKIYDEIVLKHRFREPHWVTDCSTWYNNHWQFAKCFLTTSTKGSNNTAAETDASGLLSIIINGEFFQSELQCIIDPPHDIFSQVREMRNEILHNSTLDLTDHDVTRYLESMVSVLEDKTTLSNDPAAQAAVKKLKEILQDDVIVASAEEAKAIQFAIDAITVAKEQAEESISKLEKDSLTKINAAKKRAVEEVATTVSGEIEEKYEPAIKKPKLGNGDHENRLKAVEAEQQNLKTKQLELEQNVANLKILKEKKEYLKQTEGLKQHIVHEYQKHYVKTWICPLLTQKNDVNISEVYVSPRMVVEGKRDCKIGNTTEKEKGKATNNRPIERYRDLFYTDDKRNKRIFVVGDVGTGKSSFCKMMIQNWCSSMTKRKKIDEPGIINEDDVVQGVECNTSNMNQFDFLFYIPLPEMPKDIYDTVDMIKSQYNNYRTVVDDIFTNDSERILILADGLDEWTPFKSSRRLLLHGIPTSSLAGDSTILITSRPSSHGILNLKSSEYDLKVALLGLEGSSVQPMIEKYMKLINKKSDVAAFNHTLSNLPFEDIWKAPMLLQQIIWLYCNNHNIGQSRSSVYLHIVNAVLGWEHERSGVYPTLQSNHFENLPLPNSFDKYSRCQENRELLLLIGKIANDALIQKADSVSSLVFGRNKLKQLGLSADDISTVMRTGILTEINCADPTYEKSQLSFIHTSYVEFFAALYICSCYLSKTSNAHFSGTPLTILEDLIAVTPETSVDEILRLENVLIMMCGLVQGLTEHVCELLYKVTQSDNSEEIAFVIQDLIFDCLSEHNSVDHKNAVKFKLRHLFFDERFLHNTSRLMKLCLSGLVLNSIEMCELSHLEFSHKQFLSLLLSLPQAISLRTLELRFIKCTENECEGHAFDFTHHKELKDIKVLYSRISVSGINTSSLQSCEISDCELSHEQCSLLLSCLGQALSLRTLKIEQIKCTKDKCEGHAIDLTNHKELHTIELSRIKISVSGINPTCLQSFKISDCELSHGECSLLSLCLAQSVSLQTLEIKDINCTKGKCEGHSIDLTNHKELQSITLSKSKISVSGINHTCLQSCKISDCGLSHEQCSLLSSCLSQAVSLQNLKIRHIRCTNCDCESHIIDLTNKRELQTIAFDCKTILVSGINFTMMRSCNVTCFNNRSHEQCASFCSSLSNADSLRDLKLIGLRCVEDSCEGHYLDLRNHKQLKNVHASLSNTMTITAINSTCLEQCYINGFNLLHDQCASLCSSLSHAESLFSLRIHKVNCIENTCEGHSVDIKNHKRLQYLSISNCNTISITGINPTCHERYNISDCDLSHEHCTSLCTSLSQAESLRDITLSQIKCIEDSCEGHYIDLTNHKQLDRLSITHCNTISIIGIKPTCPGSCHISKCNLSHEQCASLCTSLSQAESLRDIELKQIKCIEEACKCHDIDLANHKQLKRVSISYCNTISITGINPTCPVKFDISNCNLSHEQYTSLCSFLSETESLSAITLSQIKCIEDACEGHFVDLTNHRQLKILFISDCNKISINGINPTCAERCDIRNCNLSHEQCASLCTFLAQAESLRDITLSKIKCIRDACEGHDIDLSNHKQLERLSISSCYMKSSTGINPACLKNCEISDKNLSHEQCKSLCTSLSQAESLYAITLRGIKCIEDACGGHYIDLTNHKQLESLSISDFMFKPAGSCALYGLQMRVSVYGAQTEEQYSIRGLTSVLYAVDFSQSECTLMFRLKKSSV